MNNLTTGKVSTTLLKFAIPFLMASLLQALYGAADLFVVGQYADSAAVSAVAIGSQFMQTITGIIFGISMGGTVLIAKRIGENNFEKAATAIGSLSLLLIITALILTPLILLLTTPITHLMHTPTEAFGFTQQYITLCALGIPFIVGYNAVSGIFRGLGDSKTPVYFVQGISFFIALAYMVKKGFRFEMNRTHFKPHKESLKYILMVGLPLAVQDALVNISFLIITAVINTMGLIASAAVGVVEKLIVFAMLPPTAFGSAISAMTAQNLGAKETKRLNKILYYGIIYSLIFGVLAILYSQFYPQTLTSIFSNDPQVITVAGLYLKSFSIDCIMVSFVFCLNGYFSGQGKSTICLIHSMIATFIFRIPLTYLISKIEGVSLYELGFAAPISTFASIIICFSYLLWLNKQNQKKQQTQEI